MRRNSDKQDKFWQDIYKIAFADALSKSVETNLKLKVSDCSDIAAYHADAAVGQFGSDN